MKILVTGAAGFIGSNTCEYLLNSGHTVIAIDNFNNFYSRKIKEFNISEFRDSKNFIFLENDIVDRVFVENVFKEYRPDSLIHLAAWAGVTSSVNMPDTYIRTNVIGTNNLAEFGVKYGLKTFVFASTSSVYGNTNKTPFLETMSSDFPEAPYPATKKACEVLLYTYNSNFGLNVANFRIFNPIGIRMRPDLALAKLVRCSIYGEKFPLYMDPKSSLRDYASVEQIIECFEKFCKFGKGYNILNLGNSSPRSLIELKEIVERLSGKEIDLINDYKPGQMIETYANITKAKELLGYDPKYTLEEMVEKYYSWFLRQPEWYKQGEY